MDSAPLGNRVWRVETPDGRRVFKHYSRRRGRFATWLRAFLARLYGKKTTPTARGRRDAELAQLRHWREAGFDTPRVWESTAGVGADPQLLILEWIEGPSFEDLLRRRGQTPRPERDRLCRRLGAELGARQRAAFDGDDPSLIQEHATIAHALAAGERLVRYDHEQAYLPGQPVLPLLAKELAGNLRSLARIHDPEVIAADLDAFVAGYADDALLQLILAEVRHSTSAWRRLGWALDRRRCAGQRRPNKFDVLDAVGEILSRAATPARPAPDAAGPR